MTFALTVFLQPTCLINHVSTLSPFPLICPFFLTISNSSLPYLCLFVSPSPSFHATPFYIFLIFWSHSWLFSLDHQVFIYVDNCRLAVGVRAALMLRPLYRTRRPVTQYIKISLTLSPLSAPLTHTGMDFCIYHPPSAGVPVKMADFWLLFFRAGSLLSPKVQTSNGSFRQPTPLKRALLSTLQKPNACISPLTNGHAAHPKSPKSSSNLSSWKEEPDISTAALQFHQNKKRKKKKRRRKTEEQDGTEPVVPPAAESQVDSGNHQMRKKRKKKRQRENAEESTGERGCVLSHLDTSNHEDDWCHSGIWSLTSHPDAARQLATTTESEKGKKRKKKRRRMEALLDAAASAVAETWVYNPAHFCRSPSLKTCLHFKITDQSCFRPAQQ